MVKILEMSRMIAENRTCLFGIWPDSRAVGVVASIASIVVHLTNKMWMQSDPRVNLAIGDKWIYMLDWWMLASPRR